jgi:1-acyl-sn-glycerol-3-phosphate acyltransferase
MHGRLFIILKESLKRIPVVGWGMQLSQFIFLKRNWEKDKPNLSKHLQKLNKQDMPMWLMLFPEGTNLAPSTRKSSKKWADKTGVKDMEHLLLPRSTGLQFCLQELRETVDYVYDCTIAYGGVPRGEFAQDIYSLKASYMEGKPPKSVNMYWRRFKVSSIPLDNPKRFEMWLRTRWREKDMLIERFYQKGCFPPNVRPDGKSAGYIETGVRAKRWYEFMQVFAPVGLVALVLYSFYGALPKKFMKDIDKRAVKEKIAAVQKYQLPMPEAKMILGPQAKAILAKIEAVRQGKLSMAEQQLLMGPAGKAVIQQMQAMQKHPVGKVVLEQFVSTQNSRVKRPTRKMLAVPPAKSVNFDVPVPKKAVEAQKTAVSAAKRISGQTPINAASLQKLAASNATLKRASTTSGSTMVPSTLGRASTSAPSIASMPIRKAPSVSLPNRASSVAAPLSRKLTVPASSRAPTVVSMQSGKASTISMTKPVPKTVAKKPQQQSAMASPKAPTTKAMAPTHQRQTVPKVQNGNTVAPGATAVKQPASAMPKKPTPVAPQKKSPPSLTATKPIAKPTTAGARVASKNQQMPAVKQPTTNISAGRQQIPKPATTKAGTKTPARPVMKRPVQPALPSTKALLAPEPLTAKQQERKQAKTQARKEERQQGRQPVATPAKKSTAK